MASRSSGMICSIVVGSINFYRESSAEILLGNGRALATIHRFLPTNCELNCPPPRL